MSTTVLASRLPLEAMRKHKTSLLKVTHVLADGGYTGQSFADGVQQILGATVDIAKRNELHTFAAVSYTHLTLPTKRIV